MIRLIGSNGTLDGATPVEVVGAPAAGHTHTVRALSVFNRDTADVTVTLYKTTGGMDFYVDKREDLAPGEAWRPIDGSDIFVLDDIDQSLRVVMSGAAATTDPDFTASFLDREEPA